MSSEHATTPQFEVPLMRSLRESARRLTGYWWVMLAAGIAWVAAALVILQFDDASVTTVGILVGLLFVGAGVESIALARLDVPVRWVWALFGALFLVSAVVSFVNPTDTFAGFADMLGFLERAINPLWWTGLISGILMTTLAFWTAGQFFIDKAYLLLVFAGIWALMQGITSIVRAFEIRALREQM
jgi:uncharacterized membrane protein HdeD (DUF308 family)